MLFIMVVNLYTSRVVLSTLGVEDYGIYNVVGGVVTMFAFLNSAMTTSTQRYLTFELGKSNERGLVDTFGTSIVIHIIIALIIFVLGETVGLWFMYNKLVIPSSRMSAALWVYQASLLSTIVMVVSVPYNAAIIAHEKMSAFAYISVLDVLMKLGIVYVLCILDYDKLKLYAVLMFAVQLVIRVIYSKYCNKNFKEVQHKISFSKHLFKDMASFAGWNLWGNFASVLNSQGINILLNIYFGAIVNAARGIASQVNNAVLQFSVSFQTAINPQLIKHYASGEIEKMHRLLFTASKFSFYLLIFMTFPILVNASYILKLWLGTYPEYTVIFVRYTIYSTIINAVANPLMISASATGRIRKYQLVIGGFLLLVLPISYICLELGFNPISVYITDLIISVISFFIRIIIVKPMIRLSIRKYMTEVLSKCIAVVVISSSIPLISFLYFENELTRFIYSTALFWLSLIPTIYLIGVTAQERNAVRVFICKKYHKIFVK